MASLVDRVLRRVGECDAVGGLLPAWVAGEADLDERARAHVAQCLRCQADVARYRRMLRTLHALRSEPGPAAPPAMADILTDMDGRGRRRWTPGPWTAVALAGVAGAIGAAGAIFWIARRRPQLLPG